MRRLPLSPALFVAAAAAVGALGVPAAAAPVANHHPVPTNADAAFRSWRLYQPLSVGDKWTYRVAETTASGTATYDLDVQVVGQVDTLGAAYARVARTTDDARTGRHTTFALYRYDDERRAIASPDGALLFASAIGIGRASTVPESGGVQWCTAPGEESDVRSACFGERIGMLHERRSLPGGSVVATLVYARIDGAVAFSPEDPSRVPVPREAVAFRLWPNPASGVVHAELPAPGGVVLLDVDIYNLLGQRVRSYGTQTGFRTFDVSGLAAGRYVVRYLGKNRPLVIQ